MFFHKLPCINQFRVFGSPVVIKRWTTPSSTSGKQTERGTRGIFVGFPSNQKGYLIFSPNSKQLLVSDDVIFDESFQAAIATTWQQYQDSLTLQPVISYQPEVDVTLEQTGTIEDITSTVVEEGIDPNDPNATDNNDVAAQLATDEANDDDTSQDSLLKAQLDAISPLPPEVPQPSPQIIDAGPLRRSSRPVKLPNKFKDYHLANMCHAEAYLTLDSTTDALNWEPAPRSIREIVKMTHGPVKEAWLKSVKAEMKTLIDAKTFIHDEMQEGETSTPVMEIFKVKIKSDGSLDKLKTRLVVRRDLQSKIISEDTWSPTASFRSLKMFLAHACKNKLRVKQLDFIGAFLQANVRARIFVTIPKIFGILFPEYSEYCGVPLRLGKSMYGMTLSGKYWFLDLKEFLLEEGFTTSSTVKCLFYKVFEHGDFILLLDYVDDMLYYGSNEEYVVIFEKKTQSHIQLGINGTSSLVFGY